eukprot:CAMPEP_0113578052 /NCGR_PEP_ID=MMETSP0015_2-20120614/29243_1 /TAXON_ID=2838 /ORGANISM="Odontella" /LENGTH=269 /DNA_ID=CAMNT_0000481767 /DNA_START=14 /DNA_END=826 /DNA_ORIENTATION=- /assembly_acc=CAM_ASM_000160
MAAAASTSPHTPHRRRRPDGRPGGGTLRPLSAEVSTLSRPDGSASFSAGHTRVLAAVYGPAAPRAASREDPNGAVVTVVWKHGAGTARKGGGGGEKGGGGSAHPGYGATERELERFVGDALASCVRLERYPRSVIEVVVQVIRADGSVLGTAVNAAVMALLDAGIEMNGVPAATTCLVLRSGGGGGDDDLRLDPTSEEEGAAEAAVSVVVTDNVNEGQVLTTITFGNLKVASLLSCVEGATRAGKAVVAFMRLAVEQKVTREAQTLWSS